MRRAATALVTLCAVSFSAPALGQSFSCRIGTNPACLDWGDTICASNGKCVQQDAVCFDQWQCGFQGFRCRSNVLDCVEDYEALLADYNDLLDKYNRLRGAFEDYRSCVEFSDTLLETQRCF